jgi:hypothetical protein
MGQGELSRRYQTISVPYVQGDLEGVLTKDVIRELSFNSPFIYENEGGDLILNIKIIETCEENIGFRYDRHKDGRLRHNIIPTETRLRLLAEVNIIDAEFCSPVCENIVLESFYEFDHDYYSSRNAVNIFSLGQLTDYDEAYDAALKPAYAELAKKIVTYLNNVW